MVPCACMHASTCKKRTSSRKRTDGGENGAANMASTVASTKPAATHASHRSGERPKCAHTPTAKSSAFVSVGAPVCMSMETFKDHRCCMWIMGQERIYALGAADAQWPIAPTTARKAVESTRLSEMSFEPWGFGARCGCVGLAWADGGCLHVPTWLHACMDVRARARAQMHRRGEIGHRGTCPLTHAWLRSPMSPERRSKGIDPPLVTDGLCTLALARRKVCQSEACICGERPRCRPVLLERLDDQCHPLHLEHLCNTWKCTPMHPSTSAHVQHTVRTISKFASACARARARGLPLRAPFVGSWRRLQLCWQGRRHLS
mgnify:CR=1 FL=1